MNVKSDTALYKFDNDSDGYDDDDNNISGGGDDDALSHVYPHLDRFCS